MTLVISPPSAKRHEATILFCDIRGFTALFDQRDPLEAFEFANEVLSQLGDVIEANGGTVDKFTGDGILAHFGILGERIETHARDACICALKMQQALEQINVARHFDEHVVVQLGIGVNTGVVASGVISTRTMSEQTVLGGVVNAAARIEGLTKYFSVDCLVSGSTVAKAGDGFEFQKMPARQLRGLNDSPELYWLTPMSTGF